MFIALFAAALARRHHHLIASKIITSALGSDGVLLGKFCAMGSVSGGKIELTTPGASIPLAIYGVNKPFYCLSLTNESNAGKVLWLFANVPTKIVDNVASFNENTNFADNGANSPVLTAYQKANNLPEGYFGPINFNTYKDGVTTAPVSNYKLNVYGLDNRIETTSQESVLAACGPVATSLTFTSKHGALAQVLAVVALILLY